MVQLPPRDNQPDETRPESERPRYRPPIGMPLPKQRRAGSFALAVLLHALIVFLLVLDLSRPDLLSEMLGAGGPGPAGGGGGGNQGTGGAKERLEFVNVAPPAPAPTPPVTRPPTIPPLVPPPPPPKPVEEPKPQTPAPTTSTTETAAQAAAPVSGTGGGTGNDGTDGTGPGRGGGTGSGVGTGTGSGTGPGTGGGMGTVYPPSPTEVFLPPMPVPNRVKGTELIVQFDVDSTGKVLDYEFSPTKDGAFNRKLREVISQLKFRPAVSATGVPVRGKAVLTYTL